MSSRKYCLTFNNYTVDHENQLISLKDVKDIKYMIVGKEVAKTGTKHLQCFIHYSTMQRFNAVKKCFPTAHIEIAKGSDADNKKYCSKEGNLLFEYGEPQFKGKRNDLQKIKEKVLSNGKIPIEDIGNAQQLRFAEGIAKYYNRPENYIKKEVVWVYGPPGSGKTRSVMEKVGSDVYEWNGNFDWFDGYNQQEDVILDDLRIETHKDYLRLLHLLDGYRYRVPVKGSYVNWNPKRIFITSVQPPADSYIPGEDNTQLLRRLSSILSTSLKQSEAQRASASETAEHPQDAR